MFVDSHCHLDGPKFADDRRQALERAQAAGVHTLIMIGNGDGPAQMGCAVELVEQFSPVETGHAPSLPALYATAGIHPHEAKLATDADFGHLEQFGRDTRIVAVGEIGLDYHYDHSPREVQREVFVRQLEVAAAARKPIVIHCRPSDADPNDAWDDLFERIRRHWSHTSLGGVMHCFTGTVEQARAALDLGFMISFAGNVTYPKAQNIRDAAVFVPLDRILIETDSPYLAPVPHRGGRNEPAFVAETARFLALLRGMQVEEFGVATSNNFARFFGVENLA